MTKFRTQWNSKYKGVFDEKNDEKSMTVPSQSLTVQQLFRQHTRGLPMDASVRQGVYLDMEIPKFDDMTEEVEYKEAMIEAAKALGKEMADKYTSDKEKEAENASKKAQTAKTKSGESAKDSPEPPTED